jgi:hypothetical protein
VAFYFVDVAKDIRQHGIKQILVPKRTEEVLLHAFAQSLFGIAPLTTVNLWPQNQSFTSAGLLGGANTRSVSNNITKEIYYHKGRHFSKQERPVLKTHTESGCSRLSIRLLRPVSRLVM